MIRRWSTREPLAEDFARRWRDQVERSPHANFSLALGFLRWEATRGRHALAVLAEEEGRSGAIVLRDERRGWTSGWPWRWQALIAAREPSRPLGFDASDSAWLFSAARAAVGDGRRLRCHLPHRPPRSVPGYFAGATIIQSLQHSDDELLRSMGASKRRMVRRAREAGYVVEEAANADAFAAFHRVQSEAKARRDPGRARAAAGDGEPWHEWELPWMWLLLARKSGVVHSGVGDGVMPGGFVEGRTAASTVEARRDGAFALLGFEEARRGRDRGHRWLNHCGDTFWKREISGRLGDRYPVWCWLGGGWRLPVVAEAVWMSFRPAAARWARRWRRRRP